MRHPLKFLAFDLGAESGRAVVGFFDGSRLTLQEAHRFANEPVRVMDSLQWDALRTFHELKKGFRSVVKGYGEDIAGVGVDTWGVDFGLLDRTGELLGNPYHYRDSRNEGVPEEAFKIVPKAEIYERTGIQFMQINTLYQLLAMARAGSPALEIADTLLMMPDLFNYWFTGVKTSEFSIATTSQFYDPRARAWAKDLLEKLGIPTHILPPVVEPGTVIAPLRKSLAEEFGIGQVPIIAPATHDTGSAVAAVPAEGKDHVYISCGTWALIGVELDAPLINEKTLALEFTNEGGVCGTIRLLKNIAGLWLVQECRRQWAKEGDDISYAELTMMADATIPFASLINPDAPEFLAPGDMPARIAEFCRRTGQPVPESKAAIVRCALDSLALKYRYVLGCLEDLLGKRLEPIHMVGGGTQNKLLCRLTATVTRRTVISGPVEATAIGNILMQAIALGRISSLAEARQVVRDSFDLEVYEPGAEADVEATWKRFVKLCEK